MTNPYRITLDDASLRWAAAEGVSESVIAAICLLGEKSVDDIVAKLSPAELEQVVKIVGRTPSCYPPGVYLALRDKRDLTCQPPQADSPSFKVPAKKQARRPTKRAAGQMARSPRKATALRQLASPPQKPASLRQHGTDGENGAAHCGVGHVDPSPRACPC